MKDSMLKRFLVARYEEFYEWRRVMRLRAGYSLHIMSPVRTLRYIKKYNCCIARYGDGEFDHILDLKDEGFQVRTADLQTELAQVLANKDSRLLLCVPRCMNTIRGCNEHAGTFWLEWGKGGHHEEIISMIRGLAGKNYLFGDAQITRPYIDWESDRRARKTFPMLKSLWEGRDIIIVEGAQTRLGVGNDLFDGAKSVKRILAPAVNAFDCRTAIRDAVLEHFAGELILMALGPTATVLAAEFASMDMQALDIGNIDVEYEWYLRGAKERVAIPGKFTNEAAGGREVTDCQDEKYLSQIIARVGC